MRRTGETPGCVYAMCSTQHEISYADHPSQTKNAIKTTTVAPYCNSRQILSLLTERSCIRVFTYFTRRYVLPPDEFMYITTGTSKNYSQQRETLGSSGKR
jgi:hypothetical protein